MHKPPGPRVRFRAAEPSGAEDLRAALLRRLDPGRQGGHSWARPVPGVYEPETCLFGGPAPCRGRTRCSPPTPGRSGHRRLGAPWGLAGRTGGDRAPAAGRARHAGPAPGRRRWPPPREAARRARHPASHRSSDPARLRARWPLVREVARRIPHRARLHSRWPPARMVAPSRSRWPPPRAVPRRARRPARLRSSNPAPHRFCADRTPRTGPFRGRARRAPRHQGARRGGGFTPVAPPGRAPGGRRRGAASRGGRCRGGGHRAGR